MVQNSDSLRKLAVKIYTQVRDNFQDPTVSFDTGLTNLQQLLASHLQPQAPDLALYQCGGCLAAVTWRECHINERPMCAHCNIEMMPTDRLEPQAGSERFLRHESEVCPICKKREADSAPKPEVIPSEEK